MTARSSDGDRWPRVVPFDAALVVLPAGRQAVLTAWPPGAADRARSVAQLVDLLRARGYSAPPYLHVVECHLATAVLQERVKGVPPVGTSFALVRSLLDLNTLQRDAVERPSGSLDDLYLDRDGPGYCLHEPLERTSRATASLLARVREVGRALPSPVGRGTDVVHGDYHLDNVLVSPADADVVAGVVDWTGARVGDCGLDLVVLGFSLDHRDADGRTRSLVRERIREVVAPPAAVAFAAHLALRQVDWSIRHEDAHATQHWVTIASAWLEWAEHGA